MVRHTARRYWGLSVGEAAKYVPQARRGNFIAIGWNELPDLKAWAQREGEDQKGLWEEFRVFYKLRYPSDTSIQSGIQAGQVWSFVIGMKPGDIVLVREPPKGKVHIAEVAGAYQFAAAPEDGCEYRHRRKVRWIREDVDREALPEGLKTSLRSLLTIFNLDARAAEIAEVLGTIEVTGRELVAAMLHNLGTLDGHQFQHLVAEVLETMGFTAVESPPGPDWGTDVVGVLNASDLAKVTFRLQVKKVKGGVGRDEVSRIRGVLEQGEQGAIVSLHGFTAQARREAENPNRKPVALIDGEALVNHMLRHYDDLPAKINELLPLRRREIPPADQFVFVKRLDSH
jgi:restriction system protein